LTFAGYFSFSPSLLSLDFSHPRTRSIVDRTSLAVIANDSAEHPEEPGSEKGGRKPFLTVLTLEREMRLACRLAISGQPRRSVLYLLLSKPKPLQTKDDA
jgi:hypothetical protein